MKILGYIFLVLSGALFHSTSLWAQQADSLGRRLFLIDPSTILKDDSVKVAWSFQTSISDFQEQDLRETPGTVYIITAEQIQAMGTSDLMEVLLQIPGISLGRDVDDVIGMGVRGLWAHESKMLVMINGVALNEMDYGTFNLGQRLALGHVSRIEVSLGPGSIVHGGAAALGVINIVTRTPGEISGVRVGAESFVSKDGFQRNTVGLAANIAISKNAFLTTHVSFRDSHRMGGKPFETSAGYISYYDSTKSNDQNLLVVYGRKNYRLQFLYNDFQFQVSGEPYSVQMQLFSIDNSWSRRISDRMQLKTNASYTRQMPWFNVNIPRLDLLYSNTIAERYMLKESGEFKWNDKLTLTFGAQAYWQKGSMTAPGSLWSFNERSVAHLYDGALHGEMNYRSAIGLFKLGSRIESHTFSPLLYAPRFAWSYVGKRFFSKFLASYSFKIPTIQNVNLSSQDDPISNELVKSIEYTFGIQLKSKTTVQATVFHTVISNPIVYLSDADYSYDNRGLCGSQGIEMSFSHRGDRYFINGGACYYRPIATSDFDEIELLNHPDQYQAFSKFKGTMSSKFDLSSTLSIHGALIYHLQQQGVFEEQEIVVPSCLLLNAGLRWDPKRFPGLQCGFGLTNILGQTMYVSSPYAGDLPPLPVMPRQMFVSLKYLIR